MSSDYILFINKLDAYISNPGYSANTGQTQKIQDLGSLLDDAKLVGEICADGREKLRTVLGNAFGMKSRDIENEIRRIRVIHQVGKYPGSISEYIDLFMKKYGFNFQLVENYTDKRGTTYGSGAVLNKLKTLDADLRLYSDSSINAAWSNWELEAREKGYAALLNTVQYDGVGGDQAISDILSRFVADDDWANPDFQKAAVAVFRLWIWRVKTLLAGRSTGEHIMPYLYGPQGCGKTTFSNWFLKPFDGARMGAGLDIFSDHGKEGLIAKLPVVVFEETAFTDRASMEVIKQKMTETTTMVRDLYSKASCQRVVASFFACSNRPLDDLFRDETGMRRFFQVNFKTVPHDIWDGLDPLAVWKCVDENQTAPPLTSEERNLITSFQASFRTQNIVERWIRADEEEMTQNNLLNEKVKSLRLYQRFRNWCEEAGEKTISQTIWGKEMKKLPFVQTGHNSSGTWYEIQWECQVVSAKVKTNNVVQALFGYKSALGE